MRCIDADAYIKYINTALNDALNGATTPSGIMSCMAIVKGIEDDLKNEKITPTIEPERKKGRWTIKNGELAFWDVCSECGRMVFHKAPFYNFCPNCGSFNGGM